MYALTGLCARLLAHVRLCWPVCAFTGLCARLLAHVRVGLCARLLTRAFASWCAYVCRVWLCTFTGCDVRVFTADVQTE